MIAAQKVSIPDLYSALRKELDAHPYRTMAIAAGLGYLLGTRAAGPLLALLTSRMGINLASSVLAPLLDLNDGKRS